MDTNEDSGDCCLEHDIVALERMLMNVKDGVKAQKRQLRRLREKVEDKMIHVE